MVAAVTKQLNKNRSMDKKVTLAQLKEVVQEAYDQVKTNTGGKNADYIPYLANVNKDLLSACSTGRLSMWEILITASE